MEEQDTARSGHEDPVRDEDEFARRLWGGVREEEEQWKTEGSCNVDAMAEQDGRREERGWSLLLLHLGTMRVDSLLLLPWSSSIVVCIRCFPKRPLPMRVRFFEVVVLRCVTL